MSANTRFAARIGKVGKSFIREILKVTESPDVISFAGGLPNPEFFPVQAIADAAEKTLADHGAEVLQYRTTEGYPPLREYIAGRYARKGLRVSPDEILITTGSQQGLDLLGKVLIDPGDRVILERPSYLGAIQALGIYEPEFLTVPLLDDGIDTDELEAALTRDRVRLMYAVPDFQNPSGISYSGETRRKVAELLGATRTFVIEDDPYGELRFRGEALPSLHHYAKDHAVLLGSFSKIVAPGMRLGWICADPEILDKLVMVKQASDLHSDSLAQSILCRYLMDNDIDQHIATIRQAYGRQRDLMIAMIAEHFPAEIRCTEPEGGMFLWVTLPDGISSLELLDRAIAARVAFVPGCPFFVDGGGENTLRLNFSNCDEERIVEGIARLGRVMKEAVAAAAPLPPTSR